MKMKVYVQAIKYNYSIPSIQVSTNKMHCNSFVTVIDLDEVEVDIADYELSTLDFNKEKQAQLQKTKDEIMANAIAQCEALV